MKWKMKCWWKDLSEDLSPGCLQIVMLRTAHVVDQLHLACKPLITLLAPIPAIMSEDINTCTFADGTYEEKEAKIGCVFFCRKQRLKRRRYWSPTRVFSPIPAFLLFSGSPHLCLQPPETYLYKDSFLAFGHSYLFHFQNLPFLFSFPWIEHTPRKCNWHHMSLEEKLSIFDPWGKNNDDFRRSQIRSAQ